MEVEVQVAAEESISREGARTNTAYLVYIAMHDAEQAAEVPPLVAENDENKRRQSEARCRQAHQLVGQR